MEWARDYVREYFPDLTPEQAEVFAGAIVRGFKKILPEGLDIVKRHAILATGERENSQLFNSQQGGMNHD